jgi:hypothetical protein
MNRNWGGSVGIHGFHRSEATHDESVIGGALLTENLICLQHVSHFGQNTGFRSAERCLRSLSRLIFAIPKKPPKKMRYSLACPTGS